MLQATTASANPAVDISGNSDISNSSVKGENKGAGAAVKQSGTTTMMSAGVTGTAASGSGVEVGGAVTLDESSAKGLKAGSTDGSGLVLKEGADVSVVQDGTATPVTTAVVLEGTSDSGNAVTVDGNAAISGVILKGVTASESGAGVALKNGRLELSDNLAGVEAGSSGMGTALLMENAGLDGKGYRESGMGDYVLRPEVSGDGIGFHALGDNQLRSVVVEALSRGKGSALKVEDGTLSSDKGITAMNTGAGGTALMLDGGAIVGVGDRPVPVTLNASGEGGIALDVAAGKENALRNVLVKIIPPQETLARILLQDGVNAQTSSLTREVQEKYPEPLKDTMINVCTREDGCQSWSLNVSHPSAE
ncbi:hypothetical protein VQZ12_004867 [Salmonella enterica]|nr:hypothetical protein [Salmonella enterica]